MSQTNDYQSDTNAFASQAGEQLDFRQRHLQTSIQTLEQAINTIAQIEDCLSEMAESVLDARIDTSRVAQKNAIQETYQDQREQIAEILQATSDPIRQLLQTQVEEERLSFDPAGLLKIRLPAINLAPGKTGLDVPEAHRAFRSSRALAQATAHLDHAQGLAKHIKRHFAETLGDATEQLAQIKRVGAPAWSAKRPSHSLKTDTAQHTQYE